MPRKQKTLKLKGNRTSTCANQAGDGTTTVVLLAEEFLKEAKPFIEDGVHPQNLIQSFRTAAYSATEMIKELASPKEKFWKQRKVYSPNVLQRPYLRSLLVEKRSFLLL